MNARGSQSALITQRRATRRRHMKVRTTIPLLTQNDASNQTAACVGGFIIRVGWRVGRSPIE